MNDAAIKAACTGEPFKPEPVPTSPDGLGKINMVPFKGLDRNPRWVADKCHKTQFASNKNAPGKDWNKKDETDNGPGVPGSSETKKSGT